MPLFIPEKYSKHFLLSELHPVELAGGPVPLLRLDHALGAAHELGAVHLARHHVVKRLNLGQVNDELGVFVGQHRTVETRGLSAVHDHVDVLGLPDSHSVREVDGLVVVPHGQVTAGIESLVPGIGAVVPLDVQHLLDILYRWEY